MARTTVAQRRRHTTLVLMAGSFGTGLAVMAYVDGTAVAILTLIVTHWLLIVASTFVVYFAALITRAFFITLGEMLETWNNPDVTWKVW